MSYQEKFEKTGFASWVNSDTYPDGKIHTQEYVKWLESKLSEAEKQRDELLEAVENAMNIVDLWSPKITQKRT